MLIHRWPLRVYVFSLCFRIAYISHYDAVMYSLHVLVEVPVAHMRNTCTKLRAMHAMRSDSIVCLYLKLQQFPHDRPVWFSSQS